MIQYQRVEGYHYKSVFNEDQRSNLIKLADYLMNLPEDYGHFNMRWWFVGNEVKIELYVNDFQNKINECGTVACAAGHGPLAGIPPLEGEQYWAEYVRRAFTHCASASEWMFSAEWEHVDNSPAGAAKRIYYVLQHGVPGIYREEAMETLAMAAMLT